MKRLPLLFFLATAVSGCEVTTQPCLEQGVGLRFSGFLSTDLDSIVFRRFAVGSGYENMTAADTISLDTASLFGLRETAFPVYTSVDGTAILRAGSDYEVLVLSTGTTTRISSIVLEGEVEVSHRHFRTTRVELECVNSVRMFVQDGRVALFGEDNEYGGVWADVRR